MDNQEPESPMTGRLTQLAKRSRETVGSILDQLPPPLSTSGSPRTARPPSSATGMQLSVPGAEGRLPTPVAQWVLDRWRPFDLPEETTRFLSISLCSRIEIVGLGPHRVGADGQYEGSSVGPFRIAPGMTAVELRKDLGTVNASLQFSETGEVAKHIARLMVRTKMREQGQGEAKFLAETLVADLRVYPIDVVAQACEMWPRLGNVFFPSWAELRALCERYVEGRARLKKALEWHLADAEAKAA